MLSHLRSPARVPVAVVVAALAVSSVAGAQATPVQNTNAYAPSHVWSFDEGNGARVAHDSVGGVDGTGGSDALWVTGETLALGAAHDKVAFMFPVVGYDDPNAYIDFGTDVGKFTYVDFTVMHSFVTSHNVPGTLGDVIGNRTSDGHGNFFAVRMRGDGTISVEIDQDAGGTNYVGIVGAGHPVNDSRLHHLAYVRQQGTLSLYIDGALVAQGHTASGSPTFLSGASSFRVGRRAPFAFTSIPAFYDDLRIYNVALSADQIRSAANGTF